MCEQKPAANIFKVAIIRLKILNDTNYFGAIYSGAIKLFFLRRVLFWRRH